MPGTFPSPQVLVGGKSLVLWGPQPDSIVSGFPDSAALLQPPLKKSSYEKKSQPLAGLRTVNGSGAGPQGRRGSEKDWLKKGQESCFFSSWAVRHPGVPAPGAFNVFVVKLSAGESQHSSW